jgi:hypothetical protein
MVKDPQSKAWMEVESLLQSLDDLPAATFDALRVLARLPEMVACMVLRETPCELPRLVRRLERLPVLLQLTPPESWAGAFEHWCARDQLSRTAMSEAGLAPDLCLQPISKVIDQVTLVLPWFAGVFGDADRIAQIPKTRRGWRTAVDAGDAWTRLITCADLGSEGNVSDVLRDWAVEASADPLYAAILTRPTDAEARDSAAGESLLPDRDDQALSAFGVHSTAFYAPRLAAVTFVAGELPSAERVLALRMFREYDADFATYFDRVFEKTINQTVEV